jgi:large subunit ribosomal protein L29
MGLPQFSDIKILSNVEISEAIIKTEKELFNLTFKKATRQPFKSHEIKSAKRQIAQLKTLLTLRLEALEKTTGNGVNNAIQQNNYLTENF